MSEKEEKQKKKHTVLWLNNTRCIVCGNMADQNIKACETGLAYCSNEHAREHVNKVYKEE